MILITGANGLLGSELVKLFLAENYKVRALRRENSDLSLLGPAANQVEWVVGDVNEISTLQAALDGVETVIHAAAMVSFDKRDYERMMQVNVEGTATICTIAQEKNVKHFIMVSSIAALGRVKNVEIVDENAKWQASELNSNYAVSKYLAELEVWRAGEEGLPFSIVNPSVILGMGDLQKSSAKLFKYVWDQKPFYTDAIINYVDVKDVAEAILILAKKGPQSERFILNAGDVHYKDFFALMAKYLGRKAPSIKANKAIVWMAVIAETLKALLTGGRPLVTAETARLSQKNFRYPNQKSVQMLGIRYRPLEESIERICKELKEKMNPA